ncbi:AMP-dependent synthetase/ligase [soil metagenome]|nr:AMP-binding protein [Gemmatimonadota bacterium]
MSETVVSLFKDRVRRHADRVALRALRAGGAREEAALTWRQWAEAARQTAAALIDAGHQPGAVAAVLAGNRMLWPVADLGILSAGLVSAGLYPSSAPAQVRQILSDSEAEVVFVDTLARMEKVLAVRDALPRLRTIVCEDAAFTDGDAATAGNSRPEIVSWEEWLQRGARALRSPAIAERLEQRAQRLSPEQTAVLIYTSGSTGDPKGACISHRYLLASAASIRDTLKLGERDTTLSVLPYCHAGERVFGLYTRILCGMETGLVEDHTCIRDAARSFGPTVFGGLPRFFEKVFESLQAELAAAPAATRERWERVIATGRLRSRLIRTDAEVPAALEAQWRREGEPFFAHVREHFGGRLRLATSGGAALPMEIAELLDALGVTVLGAYGLTEHLCVAFNRPDRYAFDGVGPPMPGSELRIAADGEILVRRGPLTFSGYLNRPVETAEAFTDDGEWLCTGDLGTLSSQGILHVTGRKKELIALSTGKKVAPLPIESRLLEDPWISQAMLYGEGRKFITALICLRQAVVEGWARGEGNGPREYSAIIRHPDVLTRVQAAVNRVNANLSRTEQIRRLVVLDRDLTLEAEELTPTLKLRRSVIAERYRHLLDALYT